MTPPTEDARRIDALVAEHVMGWERRNESWYDEEGVEGTRFVSPTGEEDTAFGWGDDCEYGELSEVPHYSDGSDMGATWEVVEQMRADGFDVDIERDVNAADWFVHFNRGDSNAPWRATIGQADADTASRAICLAALRTKGVEP